MSHFDSCFATYLCALIARSIASHHNGVVVCCNHVRCITCCDADVDVVCDNGKIEMCVCVCVCVCVCAYKFVVCLQTSTQTQRDVLHLYLLQVSV
jgi:hypothetical protein